MGGMAASEPVATTMCPAVQRRSPTSTAPGLQGDERMAALQAESDRLVALGATQLERNEPAPPFSLGFIVMADPEGNEFCLD